MSLEARLPLFFFSSLPLRPPTAAAAA